MVLWFLLVQYYNYTFFFWLCIACLPFRLHRLQNEISLRLATDLQSLFCPLICCSLVLWFLMFLGGLSYPSLLDLVFSLVFRGCFLNVHCLFGISMICSFALSSFHPSQDLCCIWWTTFLLNCFSKSSFKNLSNLQSTFLPILILTVPSPLCS